MCWRKKVSEEFTPADIRFMSNGKNLFGGNGANDLNGCCNDTKYLPARFGSIFPQTDIRQYYNYDVTVKKYLERGEKAIATLSPGATVCIIADSCFSQSITRGGNPMAMGIDQIHGRPIKNRYFPNPDITPGMTRRKKFLTGEDQRCLIISGCQENQTSADAYFKNYKRYMGALSCALQDAIAKGMTWREWATEAQRLVALWGFEQIPTFEGNEKKKDEIIGSSETLILHNSSHGSKLGDKNGDEPDFFDETLFFDDHLPDDKISLMIDKIAA